MAGPSPMLEYAYFEGNIVPFADAKISVGTHALQYGTGAFAGIRGYLDQDGETINIFRLPEHAARLLNSAKLLRSRLPFNRESLAQTIVDLVEKNAPASDVYIRPFVYKSSVQLTPRLNGLDDELAIYMLKLGDYLDTVFPTMPYRVGASSPAPISTRRWPRTRPRRKGPTRPSCSTSTGTSPKGVAATSSWCATARWSPLPSPAISWKGSPVGR